MKPQDFLLQLYKNEPCTVVDVGARGGFHQLPALQEFMHVHLLEPDPEAAKSLRISTGSAKKSTVHELALGSETGIATLHQTQHGSMSSLLEPDIAEFTRSFGEVKNAPGWASGMNVEKKIEVKTSSLSDFVAAFHIKHIDFLKLDTQGNEHHILKSAEEFLRAGNVGVICCEVAFFPVYKGQSYFSEIDIFLRACGFRLVECRSYPEAMEREDEFSIGDKLYERPKNAPVGDAWYVFDFKTDSHAQEAKRAATILASETYFSEAKHILKSQLSDEAMNELFRHLSAGVRESGLKHFLRRWTPPGIQQWRAKRRR